LIAEHVGNVAVRGVFRLQGERERSYARRIPRPAQLMMSLDIAGAHAYVDLLAKLIELAGVGIILLGILLASVSFVLQGVRSRDWRAAYERYRSNLGRGILLGLELLVGADIISTITAPLTFASVGLLAGIVVIRTFLSFSLETEIEGCWPWRRAEQAKKGQATNEAR
jgi:uncharacterized membrane protein